MTPEGRVKEAVHKLLHAKGLVRAGTAKKNWPGVVTGWYYMPMKGVAMGINGIPDFICRYRGRFLAIETKAPGKRGALSPNQERRIEELEAAGGPSPVFVIDDVSQLHDVFT